MSALGDPMGEAVSSTSYVVQYLQDADTYDGDPNWADSPSQMQSQKQDPAGCRHHLRLYADGKYTGGEILTTRVVERTVTEREIEV